MAKIVRLMLLMVVAAAAAPAHAEEQWSGYYVGVSASQHKVTADWITTRMGPGPINVVGILPDSTSASADLGSSGWRYGLFGGKNWRVGENWVAGIEAAFRPGRSSKEIAWIPGWRSNPEDREQVRIEAKESFSLTARLGYLVSSRLMAYGAAGPSWQRFAGRFTCPGVQPTSDGLQWCSTTALDDGKSWTTMGWEYGAGLEWQVAPRWAIRADYRRARFDTTNAVWAADSFLAIDTFQSSVRLKTETLAFGLSYAF